MARFIETFTGDEAGNTTIDWMVLTAGLVLLGAAVLATISTSSAVLADDSTMVISQTNAGV